MFKWTKLLLVSAFLTVLLVGCTTLRTGSQSAAPTATTFASQGAARTITVVGLGQISLVPDIARISLGVEVRATTVAEAKGQVDRQMEAIAGALRDLGVADKDVQTAYYSIYYEPDASQGTVREGTAAEAQGAYRVSSMLEVTVRDISKAGAVLDGAITAGANQVYGVTFTVSNDQLWQSAAREKAMADAQARAQELAQLAGLELDEVQSVSEVIGGTVPFAAERAMGGGGGFAPGELEMTTQVQVMYAVR